jgi:hypothetical protein
LTKIRISYDVDKEIKEKIDQYHKKTGISKNRIAEFALKFYFENLEKKDD